MCWSLIVPWLFKLCSISASDILMIGLWVQLNVPFDFQLPVDAQHSPPPLPLFYCSCYLSDSSSWLCPSPLLHPGLEKTAALLSPLSYNLFLPFPCCLRCFFFSSCPTVVGFVPVISLFDLLTCDVISGFWPRMLGLNICKPASATCMCLRHDNMAFLYWHGLHIKKLHQWQDIVWCLILSCCVFAYLHGQTDVFYALKEIPQGAKDIKELTLTILPCCVNFCPLEAPGLKKIKQTFGFATGPPAPQNVVFTWTALFPSASDLHPSHLWPQPLACPNPFL